MEAATDPTAELVREASDLSIMGRHARAVGLLERGVAERPADARLWRALALALLRGQQPKRALAALDRAPDQLRGDAELARLRGGALLQLGRAAEARAVLHDALEANWRDPGIVDQLVIAELRVGDVASASDRARQMLEAGPRDVDALNACGLCALARGDWAEAESRFRGALHVEEAAAALNNLGIARLVQGDAGQARHFLARASLLTRSMPIAGGAVDANLRRVPRARRHGLLSPAALGIGFAWWFAALAVGAAFRHNLLVVLGVVIAGAGVMFSLRSLVRLVVRPRLRALPLSAGVSVRASR